MNGIRNCVCAVLVLGGVAWADSDRPAKIAAAERLDSVQQADRAFASARKHVIEQLADESLWEDVAREAMLIDTVRLAGEMRLPEAVKPLVAHMDFQPRANPFDHRIDNLSPVRDALVAIGTPALPQLIEVIATPPISTPLPEGAGITMPLPEAVRDDPRRVYLAIHCMIRIYGNDGPAHEMSKLALQRAMKTANQSQHQRIREAIAQIDKLRHDLPPEEN